MQNPHNVRTKASSSVLNGDGTSKGSSQIFFLNHDGDHWPESSSVDGVGNSDTDEGEEPFIASFTGWHYEEGKVGSEQQA